MDKISSDEPIRVLILSSEVAPYAQFGCLGDDVGCLYKALRKLGVEVRVVLPFYRMVRESECPVTPVLKKMEVPVGDRILETDVWETSEDDGSKVYFFDREDLFDRPNLYGNTRHGDYYDNLHRYVFFCRAGILLAKRLGFRPNVVHLHDWETGAVSVYLKSLYKNDPFFSKTVTVFTFHNVGYQGNFPAEELAHTGIPISYYNPGGVEFWGQISLLKAGIVFSDAISTVSPTYAREVLDPTYGMGMEGVVAKRAYELRGILNGRDDEAWNPAADPFIEAPYSPLDLSGKDACRRALFREFGLNPELEDGLLLGWSSRFIDQKGAGLLLKSLGPLMGKKTALIIQGEGEEAYESELRAWMGTYPDRIGLAMGMEERVTRRILSGVDILVSPSRYEPSGMTQMRGMKYGAIPLVRKTGAFVDIVEPYDPAAESGTGFMFDRFEVSEFIAKVDEAYFAMADGKRRDVLRRNTMSKEFSWQRCAEEYLDLYTAAINKR
ncbi:MAG: glycogen synthase [Deltaproteobacteria bacterium]|nr:glycogen synthase [Deltaproteobacteria bacterium]